MSVCLSVIALCEKQFFYMLSIYQAFCESLYMYHSKPDNFAGSLGDSSALTMGVLDSDVRCALSNVPESNDF